MQVTEVVVMLVVEVVVQTYAADVVVVVVVDRVAEGTMSGGLDPHGKWRSPATPPEQSARVPEARDPPRGIYIYIY